MDGRPRRSAPLRRLRRRDLCRKCQDAYPAVAEAAWFVGSGRSGAERLWAGTCATLPFRRHGSHPYRLWRRGYHNRWPWRARGASRGVRGPGQIFERGELLTTITVPYAPPRSFARYERRIPLRHRYRHRRRGHAPLVRCRLDRLYVMTNSPRSCGPDSNASAGVRGVAYRPQS